MNQMKKLYGRYNFCAKKLQIFAQKLWQFAFYIGCHSYVIEPLPEHNSDKRSMIYMRIYALRRLNVICSFFIR